MFGFNRIIIRIRKAISVILAMALAISCGVNKKNSKTSIILVYDEPVSGYNVSGTFYPFGPNTETGQVELVFAPVNGGDTLVFSKVDCFEEENPDNPETFEEGIDLCLEIIDRQVEKLKDR